ncbi:SLBB domain-containing protein [Daejeonella sp.]|uniref:SLBB domain-containing protein n=1 Tax=Daejeonella sp. TaxID=2805397 RepID=UPI003983BFF8
MRLRYIIIALIISVSLLKVQYSYSQTISVDNLQNLKVSKLSDQQVLDVWKRLQASGVSEDVAYQQAMQRGLPASEVEAFKLRLAEIQASAAKSKMASIKRAPDIAPERRDTIKTVIEQVQKSSPTVYGYEFFNNPKLTFEPNIRIATPKNYVLGPDDEVIINVTGLNETTITRKITPDGTIQLPYAGLVYLNGLTVETAYNSIRNKLVRIYPTISSGQTKVDISLGNVRTIRVTIIGEVKQPGTYSISSLSTLFNALYLSQGPSQNGSLRNIELIRNNRVVRTVDFYSFLQQGLLTDNVSLHDQDVIRFPVYKKRVAIAGAVKRPSTYELSAAETLQDLINYAGGLADQAYRSAAKVSQYGEKERSVRDVPSGLFDRYVPLNADSVYFEAILNRFTNRVVIAGAVYRPGLFELTPGLSLIQLIEKADGLRDDAFLTRGFIKRTNSNLQKEIVSFDLSKIKNGSDRDILLAREDSVVILSSNDLKEERKVTIDGLVQNPGIYTFRQGMTIQDIIGIAGGFSTAAAKQRVEISRILKDESNVVANQLVKTYTLELDSALYGINTEPFLLEPLDYIYIPRLVNYRAIGTVSITGEVLFPGDYSIQKRDETANEIISRAGGLTPYGVLQYAQIYRNGIRIEENLTAADNSKADALIIMAGDSIVIPRQNLYVEVKGAVNTPQLLRYSRSGFKYYINAAGGITQSAKLKSAYIQYPNGINRPIKHFLFFRIYPKVEPGSTITVPEKQGVGIKIGVGEISALTSILTAVVGLIAILAVK